MVTCALAAIAVLLAPAAAADAPTDIRLEYSAHAGCPSREAFILQVEARTDKARWVETPSARLFEVSLAPANGQTAGRLLIREPGGGESAPRELRAPSCAAVVRALSLIAALAIDPEALSARPQPEPQPQPSPRLIQPRPRPVRPAPLTPPPAKPKWRWSLGTHAGATSGLGSKLAFVLPLFVDATQYGDSWLEPSLRIGFSILPDRTVVHEAASADLSRFAVQLSGCPVIARISPALALRPCAGLELGVLRANASDLEESIESFTPWLAATVAVRLQLHPIDMLVLEAQAEAGVPFIRPRYVVEPDIEVLRLDPAYGAFTGGLGVRFP